MNTIRQKNHIEVHRFLICKIFFVLFDAFAINYSLIVLT